MNSGVESRPRQITSLQLGLVLINTNPKPQRCVPPSQTLDPKINEQPARR